MKRMLRTSAKVGVFALLCLGLTGVAYAGDLDDARIALQFSAPQTKNACTTNSPQGTDCTAYAESWPGGNGATTWVYALVTNAQVGFAGVSFGIDYIPGSLYVTWTKCADGLDFPNEGPNGVFPAPLGGNRITWDTCQNGTDGGVVTASGIQSSAGYFYLYAYNVPTYFALIQNRNLGSGPEMRVGNCAAVESRISPRASSTVSIDGWTGLVPGDDVDPARTVPYNACLEPVATKPATWGKVKTLYGKSE